MPKIYSHVDETGQDTKGELFIVGMVIIPDNRETALQLAATLEEKVGKGRSKWIKTSDTKKNAYIQALLAIGLFKGCLYYAI